MEEVATDLEALRHARDERAGGGLASSSRENPLVVLERLVAEAFALRVVPGGGRVELAVGLG
jgi:hypothetical protein